MFIDRLSEKLIFEYWQKFKIKVRLGCSFTGPNIVNETLVFNKNRKLTTGHKLKEIAKVNFQVTIGFNECLTVKARMKKILFESEFGPE